MSYTYHPKRNPHGYAIPGVPLRDLSADEYAALPPWLQRAVVASPYYSADAPLPFDPTTEPAPEQPAAAKGKRSA